MKTVTPALVVTVRISRPRPRGARVTVGEVEFDMVEWIGVFVRDFFLVGLSIRGEGRRETELVMHLVDLGSGLGNGIRIGFTVLVLKRRGAGNPSL